MKKTINFRDLKPGMALRVIKSVVGSCPRYFSRPGHLGGSRNEQFATFAGDIITIIKVGEFWSKGVKFSFFSFIGPDGPNVCCHYSSIWDIPDKGDPELL